MFGFIDLYYIFFVVSFNWLREYGYEYRFLKGRYVMCVKVIVSFYVV